MTSISEYVRGKKLSISSFSKQMGISRYCTRKIFKGMPVSGKTANAVFVHTDGQISIPVKNVGRPLGAKRKTKFPPFYRSIWKVWYRMVSSCYRKKDALYKSKGGVGITVCDKWRNFHGFYEDMVPLYNPKYAGIYLYPFFKEYNKDTCVWVVDGRVARKNPPEYEDPRQMRFG